MIFAMKKQMNKIRIFAVAAFMVAGSIFTSVHAQIEYIGMRTNLVPLRMLSPSLGADIQIAGRWQASIDGHVSLLNKEGDYLQISGVGAEGRRYFNAATSGDMLSGPYIGVSTRYMKYNDQLLSTLGRDGWHYTAGVTGGYTFPLFSNFSLDLGLGLGYVHTDFERYEYYAPTSESRFTGRKIKNSFGITQLELSVAYHFDLK